MYITSKTPRKVLLAALPVTRESSLPLYANQYSPKKFTQHQVFAILVLKEFQRCDYRKIAAMLVDCPDLCSAIDRPLCPISPRSRRHHAGCSPRPSPATCSTPR